MEYVENTEPGASVLLPAFIKKQDWEAFNLTELKSICRKLRVDADFSDKLKVCEVLSQFEFTSSYAAEFGYLSKDLKPQNNVFKYKKCFGKGIGL